MLNLNFQNGTTPALNARNMNAIVESINALGYAVGGPNVANEASEMTNTSKVYVYTGSETGYTAGNWYYYNGSAWVSGGVYQATAVETDMTLTMSGEPADAKATGDAVTNLKGIIDFDEIILDKNFGYEVTASDVSQREQNRLITMFIPVRANDVIKFESGENTQQILINKFDESYTLTGELGWFGGTKTVVIDFDGFVTLMFRKEDNSNISVSEYDCQTIVC